MKTSDPHYDSVLLAGDTGASRHVCGTNKSFLNIGGGPLLMHVLSTLEKAERIDRICVVGPRDKVTRAIENHPHFLQNKKEIVVCDQGESLFANAWKGFLHLYPDIKDPRVAEEHHSEKTVFYLSGDIPLVTPFEIDTFIGRCDINRYDYFLGISPAENLTFFYPHRDTPGVRTHFFHIREGRFRQNNLHLVKPLKVTNRHYIQKVYDYRYQRDLRNITRLALEFLNLHVGLEGFFCYSLLHWHQFLSQIHLNPLTLPTRRMLPLSFIERCISRVLGTRFTTTISPLVGAVLDIDNESDYTAIRTMFSSWQGYLAQREEDFKSGTRETSSPSLSDNNAA